MTLRQYLSIMSMATILCWISWGIVLFTVDPYDANMAGFSFFYLSFYLALVGTVSVVATLIHLFFSQTHDPLFRHVERSFREGLFISGGLVFLLFLQAQSVLNSLNISVFGVFIALLLVSRYATKPTQHHIDPLE